MAKPDLCVGAVARLRQQLREAAVAFADRICDLIEAHAAGPRESTVFSAAPAADAAKALRRDRVVSYFRAHPGAKPKDVVAALGIGRARVFGLLREACDAGALTKNGNGRNVGYFAADGSAPAVDAAPKTLRRGVLEEHLVRFIREHPGCRYGEITQAVSVSRAALRRPLTAAKEAGLVLMEGTRFQARYFPGRDDRSPAPGEAATGPRQLSARVAAFIAANPGCRYKEIARSARAADGPLHRALRAARLSGLVVMEGTRNSARYFPPPTSSPPDGRGSGSYRPRGGRRTASAEHLRPTVHGRKDALSP
jgi:predicted transcriptional regulator